MKASTPTRKGDRQNRLRTPHQSHPSVTCHIDYLLCAMDHDDETQNFGPHAPTRLSHLTGPVSHDARLMVKSGDYRSSLAERCHVKFFAVFMEFDVFKTYPGPSCHLVCHTPSASHTAHRSGLATSHASRTALQNLGSGQPDKPALLVATQNLTPLKQARSDLLVV